MAKYVPPFRRQQVVEVKLIREPTLITEQVFGADIFAAIDGSDSYTYCTWFTLHSRQEGRYCSLIHRGDGEFIRRPAVFLHNLSNQLHVRADTYNVNNFGFAYSCSEIPVDQNVHIAIVANNGTGELLLYLNGHLDFVKRTRPGDRFITCQDLLPGLGSCCLGHDGTHGSSECTFTDTCAFNVAMDEEQIRGVMMRLDGRELPEALPHLEVQDPELRC